MAEHNPKPLYLKADLSFDVRAICAEAKVRYAAKLSYINRFEGKPKRFWQLSIARRVIGDVRKLAHEERHQIVRNLLPSPLPYTRAELARMEQLRANMAFASVTARGNADYRDAAGEYAKISNDVQARAYQAVLADVARAMEAA